MPKKHGDKWKVDIRPDGVQGRRVIRLFDSKAEANFFEKNILSGRFEQKSDNRRLSDLINDWYDLHGVSLKSAFGTKKRLLALSECCGEAIDLAYPGYSGLRREILGCLALMGIWLILAFSRFLASKF